MPELCPEGIRACSPRGEFMLNTEDLPIRCCSWAAVRSLRNWATSPTSSAPVSALRAGATPAVHMHLPERAVSYLERKFKRLGIEMKMGTAVRRCTAHATVSKRNSPTARCGFSTAC